MGQLNDSLQCFSSEELLDELTGRVALVVKQESTLFAATKRFNTEGGYRSPQGKPLSQQQLTRFAQRKFRGTIATIKPLANAADQILKIS
jgi:hypothetical protein